jgi:WS/DGAT/MGAT family acyltransferase
MALLDDRGRLGIADAGFFHLERPEAPLHIAALALVEGGLPAAELCERVRERLPRLLGHGERVKLAPLHSAHPVWQPVPDLDLGAHVQRWSLPAPGGWSELVEVAEQLMARPLVRSRPLWELHVIEGLEGRRTALLHKLHHCVGDGQLGVRLLAELLDGEPAGARPTPNRELEVPSLRGPEAAIAARTLRRLAEGVDRLNRVRQAARALLASAAPIAALPWNEPLRARRRLAFLRLPLDAAQRIRSACGATLNDVVLCAVAGGLRRYLGSLGISPQRLRALVPVSLRGTAGAGLAGNRISAMLVPLAVEPPDELARLLATRATTAQLKRQSAWEGVALLLRALETLPAPLFAGLARSLSLPRLAHLVVSNVRGPGETVRLCGRRIGALYPLVPIADQLGLSAAALSYDGWIHFGLNADAERVPELAKLLRGIEESFEQLEKQVGPRRA